MDTTELLATGYEWGKELAPKIIAGVIILIIGLWVIKRLSKLLSRMIEGKFDSTLSNFLVSIFSIAMKVILFLTAASQVGFDVTSFLAIFGALMVGVGMALNGTIGHFASGVMLLIFRPFKVGDLVEIGDGHTGTVEGINTFNTTLATLDNKRVIIGNSNVTGNTITNISGQGQVGVELTFGIGYDDNIDQARKTILEVGANCPHILSDPAMGVVVAELGDSSVNLATRPFVNSENYWDTYFFMQENVKKAFDKAGIGIPYPTMDVNITKD